MYPAAALGGIAIFLAMISDAGGFGVTPDAAHVQSREDRER